MHAEVSQVGKTKHSKGMISDGKPVATVPLGETKRVEIMEDSGGFFLLRYDESGQGVGDTWHMTLAEAKAQAAFEFGVVEKDWQG
jgi:hypothetical protein